MTPVAHVQQVIHDLGYDFAEFDLQHFLQHLRQRRRRDILLVAFTFEPGISGAWVRAQTADYIFYPDQVPDIYRNHSILHEIGHILLQHQCRPVENFLSPQMLARLGEKAPGRLRQATPPAHDADEKAAEMFVTLVQQQIMRNQRRYELAGDSTSIQAFKPFIDGGA